MSKIWIELDISVYDDYKVIAHRLDNGIIGVLKGNALKKAARMINIYNNNGVNYSGIYGELEINEEDFVPIDNLLQVEKLEN